MKIYLASSWKNQEIVEDLAFVLKADCHEVDCFTDDSGGRYVFPWRKISDVQDFDAITFLADPRAHKACTEDKWWMDWADVCILVLPAGNSAHLEAGYMKGQGKPLFIFGPFPKGEFDVMYGLANGLFRNRLALREKLESMDKEEKGAF